MEEQPEPPPNASTVFDPIKNIHKANIDRDLSLITNEALVTCKRAEIDKLKALTQSCLKEHKRLEELTEVAKRIITASIRKKLDRLDTVIALKQKYRDSETKFANVYSNHCELYKQAFEKYKEIRRSFETHHPLYNQLEGLKNQHSKMEFDYTIMQQKQKKALRQNSSLYDIQNKMHNHLYVGFAKGVCKNWKLQDAARKLHYRRIQKVALQKQLKSLELKVVASKNELQSQKAAPERQHSAPLNLPLFSKEKSKPTYKPMPPKGNTPEYETLYSCFQEQFNKLQQTIKKTGSFSTLKTPFSSDQGLKRSGNQLTSPKFKIPRLVDINYNKTQNMNLQVPATISKAQDTFKKNNMSNSTFKPFASSQSSFSNSKRLSQNVVNIIDNTKITEGYGIHARFQKLPSTGLISRNILSQEANVDGVLEPSKATLSSTEVSSAARSPKPVPETIQKLPEVPLNVEVAQLPEDANEKNLSQKSQMESQPNECKLISSQGLQAGLGTSGQNVSQNSQTVTCFDSFHKDSSQAASQPMLCDIPQPSQQRQESQNSQTATRFDSFYKNLSQAASQSVLCDIPQPSQQRQECQNSQPATCFDSFYKNLSQNVARPVSQVATQLSCGVPQTSQNSENSQTQEVVTGAQQLQNTASQLQDGKNKEDTSTLSKMEGVLDTHASSVNNFYAPMPTTSKVFSHYFVQSPPTLAQTATVPLTDPNHEVDVPLPNILESTVINDQTEGELTFIEGEDCPKWQFSPLTVDQSVDVPTSEAVMPQAQLKPFVFNYDQGQTATSSMFSRGSSNVFDLF